MKHHFDTDRPDIVVEQCLVYFYDYIRVHTLHIMQLYYSTWGQKTSHFQSKGVQQGSVTSRLGCGVVSNVGYC